jgi:transcriptional regulator with XRE-family HTH domain
VSANQSIRSRIGTAVRKFREERDLSQDALAERAGMPQVTISAIERGTRTPGADTLWKLAQGLGVSPNDIFREAGLFPTEGGPTTDEPGFWELWSVVKRLSPADRDEVIRFALFREREGSR